MRRLAATIAVLLLPAAVALGQVCNPFVIDTVTSPGSLADVAIDGTTAYVAGGNAGIVAIDVSNPADLAVLRTTATGGQARGLAFDYFSGLLVVANGSAGVTSYSVSSGGVATQIGSLSLGQTTVSVTGSGTRYLVGTQEGTLYVISASTGAAPEVRGSVSLGGAVVDIAQSGQRAYCALASGAVAIVDYADSANPSLVTSIDLTGEVTSVAVDGQKVYCGVVGRGLVVVALSGNTGTEAGSLPLSAPPAAILSAAGRIFLAGPQLGLVVADDTLGSPVQIGEMDLAGAHGFELAGDTLYVGRSAQGFSTMDVGDCSSAGGQAVTRFIPAAARSVGTANTYWVTDVAVANLSGHSAIFNLAYLVKGSANPSPANVSYVVSSGQQVVFHDVFDQVFKLESANGALRVTASNPNAKVSSRTYNAAGAAGTYGQFIPGEDLTLALAPGIAGALPQLQENATFRTNIGILNITASPTDVAIDLYRNNGVLLGTKSETLDPLEMTQADRIFGPYGTVDSGYAVVRVLTNGGKVLAYASVIDNSSGDPIYIPAQQLAPGTPFGG